MRNRLAQLTALVPIRRVASRRERYALARVQQEFGIQDPLSCDGNVRIAQYAPGDALGALLTRKALALGATPFFDLGTASMRRICSG